MPASSALIEPGPAAVEAATKTNSTVLEKDPSLVVNVEMAREEQTSPSLQHTCVPCARVNEPASSEQLQVEVEKLRCRLREAEAEVQRTRERLRRQGQLVITWRQQLTDQDKVIGQLRSERDQQMREIAASVMFVEAELRREQADILALLADKDQTIAHQERQIHALLVFNRKLAAAVPDSRGGHKQKTRRHSCPSSRGKFGVTLVNGFCSPTQPAEDEANGNGSSKRTRSDCSSLRKRGGCNNIGRSPADCCHENHAATAARFHRCGLNDFVVVSDNRRVAARYCHRDHSHNHQHEQNHLVSEATDFPDLIINGQANKENVVPGMMNGNGVGGGGGRRATGNFRSRPGYFGCESESSRGVVDAYHPPHLNGVNGHQHHGSRDPYCADCCCCSCSASCCYCCENQEEESSADEEVDDYLGQSNHASSSINGSGEPPPWEHLRVVEDSVRNYHGDSSDGIVGVPYVPYPHSTLNRHLPTLEALDEVEEYDDECLNGGSSSSPEDSRINHRALLHGSFEQLAIVHDRGKHLSACYNRVMSNHRNVTKPKDVKYKKINRVKSRSLEELRGKLRNWTHPFFVSEKST